MTAQHIVALGGGGFSMEESTLLDDYVLGLARTSKPSICFVPTASGDNENYIVRFYRRFSSTPCSPCHLELFRRSVADLDEFALNQETRSQCPARETDHSRPKSSPMSGRLRR